MSNTISCTVKNENLNPIVHKTQTRDRQKEISVKNETTFSNDFLETRDSKNDSKYARLFGAVFNLPELVYYYSERTEENEK
ncbi:MAG: hypothetical protein HQM15_05595 [Deltaproteobacteria bacterium]|nr:hypothetical protein [Deltaproteobacteria bacterium]